ncbi:hypothetical protein WDW86_21230 [Bdellovibrionota bacterium FG-2]
MTLSFRVAAGFISLFLFAFPTFAANVVSSEAAITFENQAVDLRLRMLLPLDGEQAEILPSLEGENPQVALSVVEGLIDDGLLRPGIEQLSKALEQTSLTLAEQIRVLRVSALRSRQGKFEKTVLSKLQRALDENVLGEEESAVVFEILKAEPILGGRPQWQPLILRVRAEFPESVEFFENSVYAAFVAPTVQQVQDLYAQPVGLDVYASGKYLNHPRLFMFCRHKRAYPCLMVMKDRDDQPVYEDDSRTTLWHQPSLGLGVVGKDFSEHGGYTPSGIHQMDGVMPVADQTKSFGKFRRIILNFVSRSKDEKTYKTILPVSNHSALWWHESVIGRDVGRVSLRIHGTGKINQDSNSTFYPFLSTHGCVAKRENKYPESATPYKDQRELLDQLMVSSNLEPMFKNEPEILGLLYVLEIDDQAAPVTLEDLAKYAID